ncbi:DUF3099 domain-containing protein [Rhodococcus aerolatus]
MSVDGSPRTGAQSTASDTSVPRPASAASAARPVLITGAQRSYDEEHRARVKKYSILMAFRIPALVLAAIVYSETGTWWIPLLIVLASVPLPWMAVLIANDKEPLPDAKFRTYRYGAVSTQPALTAPAQRMIVDVDDEPLAAHDVEDARREHRPEV